MPRMKWNIHFRIYKKKIGYKKFLGEKKDLALHQEEIKASLVLSQLRIYLAVPIDWPFIIQSSAMGEGKRNKSWLRPQMMTRT